MPQLRQILRNLLKTPVTTGIAVASLALGIGANTAMFSVMAQILWRTLPVPEPERLAFIYHPGPLQGSVSSDEGGGPSFSYPVYLALAKQQTSFTGLAGARAFSASLSYDNQALRGRAHLVTGNYFEVLGVKAAMGRVLEPGDDVNRGGHPVAVLSYDYWSIKLGGSPTVLNQTIIVNGFPLTIVGVAPKGFANERQGSHPEVFVPLAMKPQMTPARDDLDNRRSHWLTLFGRLKQGVTHEQAKTALNVLYVPQVEEDIKAYRNPSENFLKQLRAKRIQLKPGQYGRGETRGGAQTPIYLLFGITAMVLLIACANVANLLLARGAARSKEIALRLSLGATRGQLIGQLLTESWIVALLSGLLGLGVAGATLRVLSASVPPAEGVTIATDLDAQVLLFSLALCLLTGLAFGLFPALQSTNHDLATVIKDQAGQSSGSGAANRFRQSLVTGQMAVSLMLLVTAGLFGKSLVTAMQVELGLRSDHLISFSVDPSLNKYTNEQTAAFYDQLEQRLAAIPGVSLVSATTVPAIAGNNESENIKVDGFAPSNDDDSDAFLAVTGSGYFRTMGIPLIAGREFTPADNKSGQKVGMVNETFVRFYFKDGQPVGRMFAEGNRKPDITIVGLVRDSKYSELGEKPRRVFYLPYRQKQRMPSLYFYLRTAVEPESIAPQIRRAVSSVDPNLPIDSVKTMEAQISENLSSKRVLTQMTLAFAGLAALLAGIGLYGVLAYNIARRTREIGIRMAIGATGADVRRMVVGEVGVMLAIGAGLGLAGAYAGSQVVGSLLFGMSAKDPAVFAGAAALLIVVAGIAAYVPTLRATRVNPIQALRYE
jgi:predicted permease